jgi:hypothetical protein
LVQRAGRAKILPPHELVRGVDHVGAVSVNLVRVVVAILAVSDSPTSIVVSVQVAVEIVVSLG